MFIPWSRELQKHSLPRQTGARGLRKGTGRATGRGLVWLVLGVAGLGLLRLQAADVFGPNLLRNPSFERGATLPDFWRWNVANSAKATAVLDVHTAHGGKRSVRLHNESGYAPNVYGGLSQRIFGIVPGSRYRLSVWVRGRGVRHCWFGGGPGWRTRKSIPDGTYGWRRVERWWTAPAGVRYFDFRINTDGITGALWVDDAAFQEVNPIQLRPRVRVVDFRRGPRYGLLPIARLAAPPRLDGKFGDWPRIAAIRLPEQAGRVRMQGRQGDADLSVVFRIGWTPKALFLGFDVRDDRHWAPDGTVMWRNDSVQIAFDPLLERTDAGYADADSEYSLALTNAGAARIDCWHPARKIGDGSRRMRLAAVRFPGHTGYEVRIPWEAVGIPLENGRPRAFGFSFLVNDNDGLGRRGYIELSPGIGKFKSPASFPVVFTMDEKRLAFTVPPFALASEGVLVKAYYAATQPLPEKGVLRFSAAGVPGVRLEAPLPAGKRGLLVAQAMFRSGSLPPGRRRVRVELLAGGRVFARAESGLEVSNARRRFAKKAAEFRTRLARVERLEKQARARKIPTDYFRVSLAVVADFIHYMLDDLDHKRIRRAEHVARVLDEVLSRTRHGLEDALAGKRIPPAVPRLVLDAPVTLRDGVFWADTVWSGSGRHEQRPVFFTGYGHFGQVVRDMPKFPDLGVNIIQIEIGPNSTEPAPDVVTSAPVRGKIGHALDLGAKYNVMVCMLGSPHYFPQWAFKKWPNLARGGGGFLRYTVDAPQARKILRTHFETAMRAIRGRKALHSVCLSNEPVYTNWSHDPFRKPLWAAYLRRVYPDIDALNRINGTRYRSFADVVVPPTAKLPPESEMTPIRYDAVRFNMDQFAAFHRALAQAVHAVSPGVWTHAKVMNLVGCRQCLNWGCDPEQFAALSQLNGNDCSMYFRGLGMDGYAADWQGQARYYDVQYSMRQAPIFNSEDHIIRDREQRLIPAVHTDCALWQGAIHGQGAATIWVWERTYNRKSDFEGSILHRPENVIAVGRVGLDLMRLAPEVAALQHAGAPIAVLWSITAQAWSDSAVAALRTVYEALDQTGWPVRFVSEKQAASGGLARYAAVVLPAVRHLPAAAARALAEFAGRGGRVWQVGPGPERDEHGRPLTAALHGPWLRKFPDSTDARGLRKDFLSAMSAAGMLPPIRFETPAGEAPWGVEYRSVPWRKGRLVSVVNYWAKPVSARLLWNGKPTRAPLELRSNRILGGRFLRLEPLRSLLLYVH